jgi:hypothetical protein
LDGRDLHPRYHRNPSRSALALDRLILAFALLVGGLGVYGHAVQLWGVVSPLFQ